ncbi:MAG: pirin family protein [Bacteroidota bacterium]|nr:pirin family protein [Bacteroidota bacterium]
MQTMIRRSDERGHADHGWLNSYHSFSFASFYEPGMMNFGLLRVLNDDTVEAGMGFGKHGHKNMEIISLVLKGVLSHRDSMGNVHSLFPNEVQIMSAGSGIEHSEFNGSEEDKAAFLQIWIFPKEENIKPRYGQKKFDEADRHNRIQFLVSPDEQGGSLSIHQDAWISRLSAEENVEQTYDLHSSENGLFIFVIEGEIGTSGETLAKRDAMGIWDAGNVVFRSNSRSDVLLIEVPMQVTWSPVRAILN